MVFVGSDLSRSVAFRVKNIDDLDKTLDSYKITKTQINKRTVLLSEKLVATEGMPTPGFFSRNTLKPYKKWIGDVFVNENKIHAPIFSNKKQYEVTFPFSNKENRKVQKLPKNTVSYIALPSSVGLNAPFLANLFSPIAPILSDSFETFTKNLVENKGFALLSKDEQGVGFLVSSEKKLFSTSNFNLNNLLQTISALNSPKTQNKQLKDGTIMKELLADPDLVSVEQFSLLGKKTFRTQTGGSADILGTEDSELFRISNRKSLINHFSGNVNEEELILLCGSTSFGLDLDKLAQISGDGSNHMSNSILFPLSERISELGLVNKKYSTKLLLCKK